MEGGITVGVGGIACVLEDGQGKNTGTLHFGIIGQCLNVPVDKTRISDCRRIAAEFVHLTIYQCLPCKESADGICIVLEQEVQFVV